jgi:hypothetical protein
MAPAVINFVARADVKIHAYARQRMSCQKSSSLLCLQPHRWIIKVSLYSAHPLINYHLIWTFKEPRTRGSKRAPWGLCFSADTLPHSDSNNGPFKFPSTRIFYHLGLAQGISPHSTQFFRWERQGGKVFHLDCIWIKIWKRKSISCSPPFRLHMAHSDSLLAKIEIVEWANIGCI